MRLFSTHVNQSIKFYLYSPKSQYTFAIEGFTIRTGSDTLCASTLGLSEEKLAQKTNKKKQHFNREKKLKETSGRATEEGSLSQDGQTCKGRHMYRTIWVRLLCTIMATQFPFGD